MINDNVKGTVGAVRPVRVIARTGLVMEWGEGWEGKVIEGLLRR